MSRPGQPASRVGVCSWSLRPDSASELASVVSGLGISAVQLALEPIRTRQPGWGEIQTVNALRAAGIEILSGMMGMVGEDYSTLETIRRTGGIVPDATWGSNLRNAQENARLARRLGIGLITFHAGFIPPPDADGPERRTMLSRLRSLVDHFDDHGVRVAFETGQEDAGTLLAALDELDRPHAGVNFDPANMILYGMGDPVAALQQLAPRVMQIHIKDANPSPAATGVGAPRQWGTEVRAGDGSVDWSGFFGVVRSTGLSADLVIEREAGKSRGPDITAAAALIAHHGFGPTARRGVEVRS